MRIPNLLLLSLVTVLFPWIDRPAFALDQAIPTTAVDRQVYALLDRCLDLSGSEIEDAFDGDDADLLKDLDRANDFSLAKDATAIGIYRAILKHGAAAIPPLLARLDDSRTTKYVFRRPNIAIGGVSHGCEFDFNPSHFTLPATIVAQPEIFIDHDYTVRLGDIAYFLLGKITNRRYLPIRYQPTATFVLNSPVETKSLREAARREWDNVNAERHLAALWVDIDDPDTLERRTEAVWRVQAFYPRTTPEMLRKIMNKPSFDDVIVHVFLYEKLLTTSDSKERDTLLAQFERRHGANSVLGLLEHVRCGNVSDVDLKDHLGSPRFKSSERPLGLLEQMDLLLIYPKLHATLKKNYMKQLVAKEALSPLEMVCFYDRICDLNDFEDARESLRRRIRPALELPENLRLRRSVLERGPKGLLDSN